MKTIYFFLLILSLGSCINREQPSSLKKAQKNERVKIQLNFIKFLEKYPNTKGFTQLLLEEKILSLVSKKDLPNPPDYISLEDSIYLGRYTQGDIHFLHLSNQKNKNAKEDLLLALDQSGNLLDKLVLKQYLLSEANEWYNILPVVDCNEDEIYFEDYNQEIRTSYSFNFERKKFDSTVTEIEIQTDEKPVIYGYTDETIQLQLSIRPKGQMSFSYPIHPKTGWQATLEPNGNFIVNQKAYPYLFWEGKSEQRQLESYTSGFVVAGQEIIPFLEEKLSLLGLNAREMTDFITYWGPRLIQNEYNFIYFLTNSGYQKQIAAINIEPQPDYMFRLFMYASAVDASFQIEEQLLPYKFERKGFGIIEWGGTILEINKTL